MYIFGGVDSDGEAQRGLWRCSRTTTGWRWGREEADDGPAPPALHSHSAVEWDGSMWVYGGCSSALADGAAGCAHGLHRYNFRTCRWHAGLPQPRRLRPRHRHCMLVRQGHMLLLGGASPAHVEEEEEEGTAGNLYSPLKTAPQLQPTSAEYSHLQPTDGSTYESMPEPNYEVASPTPAESAYEVATNPG
eukprot:m.260995 g.260995  ORF g.260995 m.260995 type:complete len:190 (-) comp22743_c5_seq1:78-647(-)